MTSNSTPSLGWLDVRLNRSGVEPTENPTDQHPVNVLLDLIDQQAARLAAAFATRTYSEWDERALADEVFDQLTDHSAALTHLVFAKILEVTSVHCLLDECDDETYTVSQQVAETLVAAISTQDNTSGALRSLIVDDISAAARVRRHLTDSTETA
ncbi:MAG: hypothetical protein L0H64_23165 [Pseudonocardia sp.]|nr:hypothetical protein [Pseudonocardia sp.]